MSLTLTAVLALSPAATLGHCSWDRPGVDPFMGSIPAAVDRYTDIPADVRARLKARMTERQYDEIATIRRDSITGTHRYGAEIRDMHFGQGRVCRTVSRSGWAPEAVERGLVYCESEHCIIVPTVCRNVSRITRLPGGPVSDKGGAGGGAVPPATQQMAAADDELFFEPPGAGNRATAAGQPLPEIVPFAGQGSGGGVLPAAPELPAFIDFGPVDSGPPAGAPGGSGGAPVVVPPFNPGWFGGGGLPLDPSPPPIVVPVPGVPEPSTWLLWAAGLGGVAWVARRRRARMGLV